MAKGSGKSSATSATRKKHAKKTVGPSIDEQPLPKEKKLTKQQRAQKKKEPRIKAYIPPVKPAPIQPDPLETTGLIHSLPPEFLIVLRSFNKKAQVTKIRALEELQAGWIDKCRKEGEDGSLVYVLIDMLPVWLHHVPALFTHPSRRIRLLTAGVHASLLQITPVRQQILFFLRETASQTQTENILGAWCMATHDIDKSVSSMTLKSWNDSISFDPQRDKNDVLILDDRFLPSLIAFVQRAILDPNGIYLYLNPPQPAAPVPPSKKGVRKEEPESSTRSKAEELEENDQDRKARLRVGGMGAIMQILETIRSEPSGDLKNLLKNPALWSSLYHGERCPFVDIECFGYGQPSVRKAAWALIQTLFQSWKNRLEELLPILSVSILRSAWVEPDTTVHATMWQPMLLFLKEFPNSWEHERAHDYNKEDEDGEDSDSGDSENEGGKQSDVTPSNISPSPSAAYREFLRFLESGCSGSPLQGYPTVVIILSTIPSSVLASSSEVPLADLFASFWKVLESRALSSLQRSATSAAFLSSLFESIVFLIKRLHSDSDNGRAEILLRSSNMDEFVRSTACEQLQKAWEHLVGKTMKVEERAAARLVVQLLFSLNEVDPALFSAALDTLSALLRRTMDSSPVLVSVFLKVLQDRFRHTSRPHEAAASLISDILHTTSYRCVELIKAGDMEDAGLASNLSLLVNLLNQFREGLFDDPQFSNLIDDATAQHAFPLMEVSAPFLLVYLKYRGDHSRCLRVWQAILSGVSQNPERAAQSIKPLLDAAQQDILPRYLKPGIGEVDALIIDLLVQSLAGDSNHLPFVRQVLQSPDYFLSEDGYAAAVQTITSTFTLTVDQMLSDPEVAVSTFEPLLELITLLFRYHPRDLPQPNFDELLPEVFIFAHLLSGCYESQDHNSTFTAAKEVWREWQGTAPHEDTSTILGRIKTKLKGLILDTRVRPFPRDILRMLSQTQEGLDLHFNLLDDIFPTPQEIDELLGQLSPDPIHPSLAAVTSLIPPASMFTDKHQIPQSYDSHGFSAYGRVVDALLQVFVEDRQVSKQNIWALRHFHALEIYAQDFLNVPSAHSQVFTSAVSLTGLESLISRVEQVTTYILTSSTNDQWRTAALSSILDNGKSSGPLGPLSEFLLDTINNARKSDNARDTRILRNILRHIFHDIDKNEADLWMLLARKIEPAAPYSSMAIVFAIANFAPEPPRLDRYRNELAANLLGVPPSKANTDGLLLLNKLANSAPNLDSEVVFLPQPRAVNTMKACQQWITSDEDIDEEVESVMTLVFFHLAPILQDVPGAHWDLIFDVLENNLDNSSITDSTTLVTLERTLRLILLIQDLASTNKSLRANWQERRMPVLTMVRDLATASLDSLGASVPRSVCRGLILSIIQDLPPSLIDQETLPKMSHLIMDTSVDVQKTAYRFLESAAKKRTEYFVIEAGVDIEATVNANIPVEILNTLQHVISFDEDNPEPQNIFGYLLGWMLLFDLFQDASLKVRASYIEQLRNLDIVGLYFIPNVLRILRLDQGPLKAFKLDIWAVDEFYVEFYEGGKDFSLCLLAAHLYYRALLTAPSLIHAWVLDCKDRQLSSSITNYTSQYFSPVIIQAELAHVKSPEATTLLVDENLAIKVASSVNEVVASYSVDDHQLEIKLKIPSDWPLHKIEIKDLKRVGVDENRWRAWILAVQQIIWSHNGRIVDGLGLFKKNVTLHFEGQVECAICYSIISVTDGSLPRKPCKTCKNRFHAGCLYKWFNSSHSSSCPLCRSDIF